ncbi:MAG TPA: RNA polymerase sigma factor [Candidatus Cybelea sp.]|jgi:RNA polymerase sigma-70 factor (ECF subfamily)
MPNQIGTEQALAEALLRLRPALAKRACAIIRNHADVEDVVQESAARAWGARDRLRPGSDPAPWLNTIVTRVAIDFVRMERRRAAALPAEFCAHDPPPEEQLLQSEAIAAVGNAAQRLATAQRRALFMHDVMGFTSHEIAHLDEIPYHTVRTRLHRARQSVRSHLQGTIL